MSHIQENAEKAVRQLLRKVAKENMDGADVKKGILRGEDTMDDGTPIRLAVEIDYETVCPSYLNKPPKMQFLGRRKIRLHRHGPASPPQLQYSTGRSDGRRHLLPSLFGWP
jgi:hypothetical protein